MRVQIRLKPHERRLFEILAAAALMGLIGSTHCVGMCGPFALACGGRRSHLIGWQAGKAVTYITLGALAGWIGGSLLGPVWLGQLLSVGLILWFTASLLGWAPEPAFSIPGVAGLATRTATRGDVGSRIVFGVANGLLPCGLVYAALGLAVAAGDALAGGLVMVAFAAGTTPLVSAFAMATHGVLATRPKARRAVALVVCAFGIWAVVRRGGITPPL